MKKDKEIIFIIFAIGRGRGRVNVNMGRGSNIISYFARGGGSSDQRIMVRIFRGPNGAG